MYNKIGAYRLPGVINMACHGCPPCNTSGVIKLYPCLAQVPIGVSLHSAYKIHTGCRPCSRHFEDKATLIRCSLSGKAAAVEEFVH